MDKLILFVYLCFTCTAMVSTTNTTLAPKETSPTHPVNQTQPTKQAKFAAEKPELIPNAVEKTKMEYPKPNKATTNPKNQPKNLRLQNNGRYSDCRGWCFREVSKPLPNDVRGTSEEERKNSGLKQRFATVQSAVDKIPYLPVKVRFNLYADSNQYNDRAKVGRGFLLANKNVVRVPGNVFYPYTRISLRDLLEGSGIVSDFAERSVESANSMEKNKSDVTAYLNNDFSVFTNQYFKSKPALYNVMTKAERRANLKKKQKRHRHHNTTGVKEKDFGKRKHNHKEDGQDYTNSHSRKVIFNKKTIVEDDNIKSRSLRIDDFVFGRTKHQKRFNPNRFPTPTLQDVLGLPEEETMLGLPKNEVTDVVAGMKIKSNTSGTFVIGATQEARRNINRWFGPKTYSNRRTKIDDSDKSAKTGVVLEGETKTKAVDKLLKSMVTNYQYENKTADEKKHQKRFIIGFCFGIWTCWG